MQNIRKSVGFRFLCIIAAFVGIFSCAVLYFSWSSSNVQMEEMLKDKAELVLQFDLAIRSYVTETIRPFAQEHTEEGAYIPEIMSTSVIARNVFDEVFKEYPEYVLKFSSDNPCNPSNQAGTGELKIIEFFNDNRSAKKWSGKVQKDGQDHIALFNARRMKEDCLQCHGDPKDAPASMIAQYGDKAGFHRPVGEVVALDTIALPVKKYQAAATMHAIEISLVMIVGLALLLIVVYCVFQRIVGRRLRMIADHFKSSEAMLGKLLILPSASYHDNEIDEIVYSYNKMVKHLDGTSTSIGELNKEMAEQKLIEKELSKRRNHLEGLVAEHAASLEKSDKKLAQSNTELQEFVYIASHDLREPLRKISSFGELVKDSLSESLKDDDKKNLDFMIAGAEKMSQMVEALSVYSQLSKNDITLSTVDLNEVIGQFNQLEFATLLEETNATIDVPQTLPTVKADKVLIRQLIQILISNGIQYQKPGTAPRIEITAREIGNDNVRIEFKDNGIGIKRDMHQTIFKMFQRVHSNEEYQGTGIGLTVCKKIAEKHGCQIGVDSEEGKGSVFWFTIPLEKEPATVS